jgi:hypothetical protein
MEMEVMSFSLIPAVGVTALDRFLGNFQAAHLLQGVVVVVRPEFHLVVLAAVDLVALRAAAVPVERNTFIATIN